MVDEDRDVSKDVRTGAMQSDGYGYRKSDRLLKRAEYLFLKSGKSLSNRYFIAAFHPNSLGRSRLGVTVTRRVGNAVVRNRIKRIVREYFRLNHRRMGRHLDVNVIAKHSAADVPTEKAFAALNYLFDRIGRMEDQGSVVDHH